MQQASLLKHWTFQKCRRLKKSHWNPVKASEIPLKSIEIPLKSWILYDSIKASEMGSFGNTEWWDGYEIIFPDPMSFYINPTINHHKPSHSPFGGHGFSHPIAFWALPHGTFQALRRGTLAERIGWFHALPVAALGVLAAHGSATGRWNCGRSWGWSG